MQESLSQEEVYQLVLELRDKNTIEKALASLSKKREDIPDLALILWCSFGTITCLLQEIVSIYPHLNPPSLTNSESMRACNALALLQCVAAHSETRPHFLNAHIPLYLYPLLNTTSKTKPFEYLRLTSLGVIGALVKNDTSEVINFLLSTEIIPLCLRIMEIGSEITKTVAIFIIQKILLDGVGLAYICQTYERFHAVVTVLNHVTEQLVEHPAPKILKNIIRCYLRLSDDEKRAKDALRQSLPESLKNNTFAHVLKNDPVATESLTKLLSNLFGQ